MRYIVFLLFLTCFEAPALAAPVLSKSLSALSDKDTICNVWVFFKNRPPGSNAAVVSRRAMERHRQAFFRPDESSRPLERRYIKEIEKRGAKLRHQFHWENAASFTLHASAFEEIAALPFVKYVRPVNVYVRKNVENAGLAKSQSADSYRWHLEMVNVILAHEYLRAKKMGDPGRGVLLAFFDGGFRFDHDVYRHAVNNGLIVSRYDFVDNKNSVSDPSVTPASNSGYDNHGTQTLSLVAGYAPGEFTGIGWGANFAAARTEDHNVEARVEEDNWAAAVVWADSIGADIISSSLGYRYGFEDGPDYSYGDMDGGTTIVSRAAAAAVKRGMIVVNSMGNEGNSRLGTLSAPADVDGVISVGAVNQSRHLAGFSSSGPTFDGRIKPDLCAPGVSVKVPYVYLANQGSYGYTENDGTSFSAPIAAGICALILQANREKGAGINAAGVKEKLYASCGFANGQTGVDYRHGRGIPNALLAIMDDDEVFIKITDNAGNGLYGARITGQSASFTTNESGVAVAKLSHAQLPFNLKVLFRGEEIDSINVNSLPFAQSLALDIKWDEGLRVLPGVIKRGNVLKGRYLFYPQQNGSAAATVAVVSLNGRTLWNQKLQMRPDGSAEFFWDCKINGRRAAPGVYFLTLRHNGKMVNGKFVIAG